MAAKPKAERTGHCTAVGSWSPGEGRKRVAWRCRCESYSNSVELTTIPWQPVCICGHTQAVHTRQENPT